MRIRIAGSLLILMLGGGAVRPLPVRAAQAESTTIIWHDALRQKAAWYGSNQATRVADNLILYQRSSGGWPKNIDMAAVLTADQRVTLSQEKRANDSTIDNGATYT